MFSRFFWTSNLKQAQEQCFLCPTALALPTLTVWLGWWEKQSQTLNLQDCTPKTARTEPQKWAKNELFLRSFSKLVFLEARSASISQFLWGWRWFGLVTRKPQQETLSKITDSMGFLPTTEPETQLIFKTAMTSYLWDRLPAKWWSICAKWWSICEEIHAVRSVFARRSWKRIPFNKPWPVQKELPSKGS